MSRMVKRINSYRRITTEKKERFGSSTITLKRKTHSFGYKKKWKMKKLNLAFSWSCFFFSFFSTSTQSYCHTGENLYSAHQNTNISFSKSFWLFFEMAWILSLGAQRFTLSSFLVVKQAMLAFCCPLLSTIVTVHFTQRFSLQLQLYVPFSIVNFSHKRFFLTSFLAHASACSFAHFFVCVSHFFFFFSLNWYVFVLFGGV